MHVYLWTIYSCSSLRGVQALQEDVRIQDGEEIAACLENNLLMDSLALLCKMLPEKAERHSCLLCIGELGSSFIQFLSDFSCNIQPLTSFLVRLSPATFVFVFAFASASLINFGLE